MKRKFEIGDRVNAPGRVGGTVYGSSVYGCEVRWDDGKASSELHSDLERAEPEKLPVPPGAAFKVGDRVTAPFDLDCPDERGTVLDVYSSGCIDVQWDDDGNVCLHAPSELRLVPWVPTSGASGLTGDAAMDALLRECVSTMKAKGHEYTGGNADRLNNFRTIAQEIGLPMRQVWYVYFNKHLRALQTWVRDGELKSNETINGRMVDLINYLLLGSLIATEEAKP